MDALRCSRMLRDGILALISTLVACVNLRAQEMPPALKSRIWDIHMEIPAGSYRAIKPVELVGELEIRIHPGAWIEAVDFQSKKDAQRWDIDGSVLKGVRIGPPLGGRFVAKNSVFDDCLFYKKPSNFDPFWSTRWKFENCIVARSFMNPPVNMADFSIVARSCTFVGIEFPGLGLKERTDPATYLQSENFIFERCRFIRCKVPPTVLAASKDCVFEQCTFLPMKGSWPPESTEIRTTAYWDGSATPTKPSVRKPLTVDFEKVPADFGPVGSSIEFTHSGGMITLKDIPKPSRFESIATTQINARELAEQ